nr:ribonuclease P protein component [Zeimonas sediminis]
MLRSRPGAVGEHFVMHWKPLPASHAGAACAGVLFLAVPKRQLARAVDRNLVRRIAREAWRAAGLSALPLAVLVRLRRRPDWFAEAGVRRRRQGLRQELDSLFSDRAVQRISDTLRRHEGPGREGGPDGVLAAGVARQDPAS